MSDPKTLTIKVLSDALDAVEEETRSVVAREKDLADLKARECESSRERKAPRCGHCLHVQGESEARLDAARGRLRDVKGRVLALVAEAPPKVLSEAWAVVGVAGVLVPGPLPAELVIEESLGRSVSVFEDEADASVWARAGGRCERVVRVHVVEAPS